MLFSAKVGQEIRPMNKLSHKRIKHLSTHGKEGWGEGKMFFHRDVIAVIVKAEGRERGNACLLYTNTP